MSATLYETVDVVFPQEGKIPPNILLAQKTKGVANIFSARDTNAFLVLWKKGGNICTRILANNELQRFLGHYEYYGWKHYTRIYQIDARILWTIVRGKLRKPIRTSLF